MKDLQAMDRAHRLGQKRVVNVYRLITKETLEEKIMGLQRFKLHMANTIINQDNSGGGLKNMGSDEILNLFQPTSAGSARTKNSEDDSSSSQVSKKLKRLGGGSADWLQELDSIASQNQPDDQYETEFSMDSFMNRIGGK